MQRLFIFLFIFVFTANLANAQRLNDLRPARVTLQDGSAFKMSKLFDPAHFKLGHSYELAYNSFGGSGMSTGIYTASLNWQFNKADANVDVGFLHTPFGQNALSQAVLGNMDKGKMFIRNAEINVYPTKNMQLHLAFRQVPANAMYGGYGNYGGYSNYGGYGYNTARMGFGSGFNNRYGN